MTQAEIPSGTKELAERLIGFEAARQELSAEEMRSTCRVCEKLRHSLSHLAGTAGFAMLLGRALTLAKREAPVLKNVHIEPDGTIDGLEGEALEGNVTLVSCLLTLLNTFIGEPLTLRLLHEVWPSLSMPETTSGEGNLH